jgi:ribosome-associated protein
VSEPKASAPIDSKDLALRCAQACVERKGEDVVVLDIGKSLAIADYFVVATGRNKRHLKSMSDGVRELARGGKRRTPAREEGGVEGGRWLLLDLGDVIVHLFDAETRGYYDIDGLWADAPRIHVS